MNSVIDFSGRFHPVLVHLPIGFLLLAVIFQWLSVKEKYTQLRSAIGISFLLGSVSAVLSCITGLALSSSGEYDPSILGFHQWFGIAVAVVSFIAYILSSKPFGLWQRLLSVFIFILIVITGHLGGALTHGEGFLTEGINTANKTETKTEISNIQEAAVFVDIIQPVLNDKCGSCHSASKQKGNLRLDGEEWIMKGGKSGKVFLNTNAGESELYKRIILDPLEKKHMPPKGKPQLTESEINLLHWWINSGAGFDKKVKDVTQPAPVTAALRELQSSPGKKSDVPETAVDKAPQDVIDELRKSGVAISQIALNSNYLQASFVIVKKPGEKIIGLLKKINKQLIWLKMPGIELSADEWKIVAECKSLTRLSLEQSNISDTTLLLLNGLRGLHYLNLVGTKVSLQSVQHLKNLQALTNLYLGKTNIKGIDFAVLQKSFPKTSIDSGNYTVGTLVTDTQLLKPPVKK